MFFKLSKNKNIRKTIFNVVAIYLSTTILLVLTISFFYMQNQKKQLFDVHKKQMDSQAIQIIEQLEILHDDTTNIVLYPRYSIIKTAIYDIDKNLIFSTFKEKFNIENKPYIIKDNYIYFIYKVEPYYLGAAYLVIQTPENPQFNNQFVKTVTIIGFIILFLILTSFILAKILIKPLSDNLDLLDKFIKDTTHELNTPLSAILNNIEMLNLSTLDEKNMKKIHRIKIGATTIATMYEDLSFLLLNNKQKSNDQQLDISKILNDRIEYFKILSDNKKITIVKDIDENVMLYIDKLKIERLFDNLISNAIKYSNPNSHIDIFLTNKIFVIQDYGIGMKKDEVSNIFIRYKRFDNSVGGFGIGYDIIHSIVTQYNIAIDIKSYKNKGTKVTLQW